MPQTKQSKEYLRAALREAKRRAKRVVDAEAARPRRGRPRTKRTALADARRQADERLEEETIRALAQMPREGRAATAPLARETIAELVGVPVRRVREALGAPAAVVVSRMRKQVRRARGAKWRVKALERRRKGAKKG